MWLIYLLPLQNKREGRLSAARLKIRGLWIETGNIAGYRTVFDCISDVEDPLAVLDRIYPIYDLTEPPKIVLPTCIGSTASVFQTEVMVIKSPCDLSELKKRLVNLSLLYLLWFRICRTGNRAKCKSWCSGSPDQIRCRLEMDLIRMWEDQRSYLQHVLRHLHSIKNRLYIYVTEERPVDLLGSVHCSPAGRIVFGGSLILYIW